MSKPEEVDNLGKEQPDPSWLCRVFCDPELETTNYTMNPLVKAV